MNIVLPKAPEWDLYWSDESKKDICTKAKQELTATMFFEFGKVYIGLLQEKKLESLVRDYEKNMASVMMRNKEAGAGDTEVSTQIYSILQKFINSNSFHCGEVEITQFGDIYYLNLNQNNI